MHDITSHNSEVDIFTGMITWNLRYFDALNMVGASIERAKEESDFYRILLWECVETN